MERRLGLHQQALRTPKETFDLLGLDRFKRVFSRPKAHAGQRFAVHGFVDEYMGLPDPAARVLKAKDGGRFRVWRDVADGLRFYTTVFARTAARADRMMTLLDTDKPVSLLVTVLHAPARGDWTGFFWFEHPPKPRDLAFVIEEFLPTAEVLLNLPPEVPPEVPESPSGDRQGGRR
jgi:hypothetical protein